MGPLELAGGVLISGALGALAKHKTALPHKATGVPQNVLVGQAAAAIMGGSPEDGIKIAILTEAALNATKGSAHALRSVVGFLRRIVK